MQTGECWQYNLFVNQDSFDYILEVECGDRGAMKMKLNFLLEHDFEVQLGQPFFSPGF